MRISIVTPSFNHGQFIEETILSVVQQNHDDVEHIVMDGGSLDGTVSILKKYPHLMWVSEEDKGQAHAINKGFRQATGDIIAWINSDDYYEKNVFRDIVAYFEAHPDCMLLYGDITYVDREGRFVTRYTGDAINYDELVRCPDIVRQPSFFWRRSVMEEIGEIDERLRLVLDFDFFLRVARKYRFHYLEENLSYFRTYEENKTSSFRRRQVCEIYKVFRKQNVQLEFFHLRYFVVKLLNAFGVGDTLRAILRSQRRGKQP